MTAEPAAPAPLPPAYASLTELVDAMDAAVAGGTVPDHPLYGHPERIYVFRNSFGSFEAAHGYFSEGQNAVWTRNGVGPAWTTPAYPVGLYSPHNAAHSLADTHYPAILCFDEQAADAASYLFPDHIAYAPLTFAPEQCDLLPFKGRHVLIWPAVGSQDVAKIWARAIKALALIVKVLKPPAEMPVGWDANEALSRDHWGATDAAAWLLRLKIGPPHVTRPAKPETPAALSAAGLAMAPGIVPLTEPDTAQYQVLGYDEGHVFVLPAEAPQVMDIPIYALGKASLPGVAPLQYWQANYPGSQGVDWPAASNAVIRTAYSRGVYDPGKVRGRGAWHDEGRVVLHLGDRLLVDGEPCSVRGFKSRYFYTVRPALEFGDAKPLSDTEARKFPEFCAMLSWHRPVSALYLSGWCIVAQICGALSYRPHLFLTGAGGSGKSWAQENVLNHMIGDIGLFLAASTTEPGIRRELKWDARPVIIDEFEGLDAKGVERVKAIYQLMRYATTETGAKIVMGKTGGGTESFRPRFSGVTSGIGKLLTDYADTTRHSVCSMKIVQGGAERERRFTEIKAAHRSLLTPQYVAGMQARIVRLIPTIRANAETFASAGASVFGARRVGDQIGTLAAGRYACESTHRISMKAAMEWWGRQELDEEREQIADTDGPLCFARIMEHRLRVDAVRGGQVERSIGELAAILRGADDAAVSTDTADATLKRSGIFVKDEGGVRYAFISNTHSEIAAILRGTPWPLNWRDRLRTIPGTVLSGSSLRYGVTVSKAVGVPLT